MTVGGIASMLGLKPWRVRQAIRNPGFLMELDRRKHEELKGIEHQVLVGTRTAIETLEKEARTAVESKDRIHAAEILLEKCMDLRPEASKKALVEMNTSTHQHLNLSGLTPEQLGKLLGKAPPQIEGNGELIRE